MQCKGSAERERARVKQKVHLSSGLQQYYRLLTFRPGVGHLLEQGRVGDVRQPLDRFQQMHREAVADAGVEQIAMLVQDEVVRVAVQLLEA